MPVQTAARALARMALALAVACSCAAFPAQSFAYFDEVDDKNSAQQDIGEYGDAIRASEIPEGTYQISARTSSRMCVFYDTAEDAATRSDNKELCTLIVSGGSMKATFYMTAAYTHIYMGTGEQAAKLADETGTDDSPYVKGEAHPVKTSSGTVNAYRYTMAVPTLNSPITFASYDGGSAGIESGKWFNRQVVFSPSNALLDAIAGVTQQEEAPATEPGAGSQEPEDEGFELSVEVTDDGDQQSETTAGPSRVPTAAETGVEGKPDGSEAAKADGSGSSGATGKVRGMLMRPAQANAAGPGEESATVAVAEDAPEQVSPAVALAFSALAIAAAGALARTALFAAGKRGWRG